MVVHSPLWHIVENGIIEIDSLFFYNTHSTPHYQYASLNDDSSINDSSLHPRHKKRKTEKKLEKIKNDFFLHFITKEQVDNRLKIVKLIFNCIVRFRKKRKFLGLFF